MLHLLFAIVTLAIACLWAAGAFESFRAAITGTEDRTSKATGPYDSPIDPKAVGTRFSSIMYGIICLGVALLGFMYVFHPRW
jgi:hypothetical protein